MNYAYWILPKEVDGKPVIYVPAKHINDIIAHPKKFGETKESVLKAYKKYNEPMGVEGKAREELIKRIFKRGFARVRFNMRQQKWSIQTHKLSDRMKDHILEWVYDAIKQRNVSPESMVYINTLIDGKVKEYKLEDMIQDRDINEQINITDGFNRQSFFDGPDWIEYSNEIDKSLLD
jgi:hypothetical protein